jgi:hypothetical protein
MPREAAEEGYGEDGDEWESAGEGDSADVTTYGLNRGRVGHTVGAGVEEEGDEEEEEEE